jgi:CheY-like chemotaxis protein
MEAPHPLPAHVLVVEDSAEIREALAEILHHLGYRVDCVANGKEAWDYLHTAPPPTLILLDLVMPVMDGWEFRRRQQQDSALAAIPVVILAGQAKETAPSGAAAYLARPIDVHQLCEIVARYCRGSVH